MQTAFGVNRNLLSPKRWCLASIPGHFTILLVQFFLPWRSNSIPTLSPVCEGIE
jgi:hypothetical protein